MLSNKERDEKPYVDFPLIAVIVFMSPLVKDGTYGKGQKRLLIMLVWYKCLTVHIVSLKNYREETLLDWDNGFSIKTNH